MKKEEWGVFEVFDDNDVLRHIHVMPCNEDGTNMYRIAPDAHTIKEVIEPTPLNGNEADYIFVHIPIQ